MDAHKRFNDLIKTHAYTHTHINKNTQLNSHYGIAEMFVQLCMILFVRYPSLFEFYHRYVKSDFVCPGSDYLR